MAPFVLKTQKGEPIDKALRESFKKAYDAALSELNDYLQKNSPRGISVRSDSLAGNWSVATVEETQSIIPKVLNRVTNTNQAEFRIRGRAPGRFPPFGKGSELEAWAKAAGIPAFLVAKAIAEKGTERWRTRDNVLKQDPVSLKFDKDSPLYTVFEKRLQQEWNAIRLK